MKWCGSCRWHSKDPRLDAVSVGSKILEKIKSNDDPITFFICKSSQQDGKEIGREDATPRPGEDCPFWEEAKKKALDPELERLVARKLG